MRIVLSVEPVSQANPAGEQPGYERIGQNNRVAVRHGEECRGYSNRAMIREVLLQVAVYCGVPAGIDSTRIAREAFAEVDQAKQG